uniref:Protein kinase domain-containing protein n=1 Tax=Glossina brevipalpis TaxID=37001 RepID=A0A1A9W753_9MUSC
MLTMSQSEWKIGASIGLEGFGEIYTASKRYEKNYDYVVKYERGDNGPLFVEMHFYRRNTKLSDINNFKQEKGLENLGVTHMLGNGTFYINDRKHRFIVLPRYDSDINKHFLSNSRCLPEITVYRIVLQMLDTYDFIHSSGYVDANLKASNILLGNGKGGGDQTYLVDYGLAHHYTTEDFKPDPQKIPNGTIEYTSRDAHQGVLTRRGDFEILGYNIIEWLGVELPWIKDKILATPFKVQEAKEAFMMNVSVELKELFPHGTPPPPRILASEVTGEASESDEDVYDKNLETATESKTNIDSLYKNNLLQRKLKTNVSIWRSLNSFVKSLVTTASKQLLNTDQLLIKSQVTMQAVLSSLKLAENNMKQLHDKCDDQRVKTRRNFEVSFRCGDCAIASSSSSLSCEIISRAVSIFSNVIEILVEFFPFEASSFVANNTSALLSSVLKSGGVKFLVQFVEGTDLSLSN